MARTATTLARRFADDVELTIDLKTPEYPWHIDVSIELVTPERAEHYLEVQHSNRGLSSPAW